MKKAIVLLLFGFFGLFSTSIYAENSNISENKVKPPVFHTFDTKASNSAESNKVDSEKKRYFGSSSGIIRDKKQEISDKVKEKIDDKRKEIIRRYFHIMLDRFEAAIMRLDKLISRIENRLGKIKAEGQNTSLLDTELGAAKDKLALAKAELKTLRGSGDSFTSTEDPKSAFAGVKQKVQLIRDEIKGVHQALVQIIIQMKGLHVGESSTPSGNLKPKVTPTGGVTPVASPSGSL